MNQGLKSAVPPPPPKEENVPETPRSMNTAIKTGQRASNKKTETTTPQAVNTSKFAKISENTTVQFNKRVKQRTADTFDILAVTTKRKVPELLEEAADFLQEKYGNV